jgi:hypothetical protein
MGSKEYTNTFLIKVLEILVLVSSERDLPKLG